MAHSFDKDYWDRHWRDDPASSPVSMATAPPNPHLVREIGDLTPGTALDAGCGGGAEAIWLAERGWQVTGADIAAEALAHGRARAAEHGVTGRVHWVQADLSTWDPGVRFDLVTTHYAHPAMPQLEFYDRVASWVAPGGTLLIVGHGAGHGHGSGDTPIARAAAVSTADITARLDSADWQVVTAGESHRTAGKGDAVTLHDIVVRATRRR